jgi:Beta-propeller repeat
MVAASEGYNPDVANAIAVDGSGNVYVTGGSYTIESWTDYATIKYNSAGSNSGLLGITAAH